MSGSFWKFSNGFSSLSNISSLLEGHAQAQDENGSSYLHTLEVLLKLLDEKDLFQELLSNSPLLVEFLRDETVLRILVNLVNYEGDVDKLRGNDEEKDEEKEEKDESQKEGEKVEEKEGSGASTDQELTNHDDNDNSNDKSTTHDDDEDDDDTRDEDEDQVSETEEEIATRRATIAAEILSADVWSLTDTVMESVDNLNQLWAMLDLTEPLSINLSTYFMKIMEHLLDMKCDEMISYLIDHQTNLVEKFMNHLSNPPLMDFLLKLILTDKPDNSTGIIDFLQEQELIPKLVGFLDNSSSEDEDHDLSLVKQSSAADFLKALITISANSNTDNSTIGPNELTRELVSHEQMENLCNIMLKGGYALANGVGIIIEIIRKNNSDYDILPVMYITLESHPPTGRDPIYLGHLLKVFGSKIEQFNELLMKSHYSDEKNKLKTPFGEIEPLGFERFKICELVAELLHCSNMALLNDNKGFDVVKKRDELRVKMKEYDPISFKYNEVIVLPKDQYPDGLDAGSPLTSSPTSPTDNGPNADLLMNKNLDDSDDYPDDTIDSFNSKLQNDMQQSDELVHEEDDEEPHANTNLTEEQIRANPVVGDFLKISLFDTQIISNILSMFFKFPWNNFLHNVVFDIVQQVLNGSMDIGFNKFMAIDLFHLGDITNKIIEGQKLCTDYEKSHNGLRLGFMGHLTLIAEEVVKFIQLYPANSLSELIDVKVNDNVWEEYVSQVLYDTREKYNAILGGGEDEEDEEEDEESKDDQDYDNFGRVLNKESDDVFENEDVDNMADVIQDVLVIDKDAKENQKHRFESDESESDDDDHFTNYMSDQLTKTPNTEFISKKSPSSSSSSSATMTPTSVDEFDDDEYIDPNDDGLSYKKSNPLYDNEGSLLSQSSGDDDLSSEESSSSSDEEEDSKVGAVSGDSGAEKNGAELTRADSKG